MAEEDDDLEQPGGLRSFWTGTITFGLVTVPVALYSATRPRGVALKMIGPDEAPVRRRYVCSKDGKVLDPDDIVRGYEVEKGKFVVVTDEELEAIEPRKTKTIDIEDFVDLEEIDPIYFRKAYYLLPQDGAAKPYRLLVRALDETGKVGIAKVVIRNKQHLACVRVWEDKLLLETMYYADEVRRPEKVTIKGELKKAEVEMAKSLVENLTEPFDPEKYDDDYRANLMRIIRAKMKGKKVRLEADDDEPKDARVLDLMSRLQASLTKRGRAPRGAARKGPPSKARKVPRGSKRKSA